MPNGSGNSGYNSQGNHYNTPGGSNSNQGNSYHCKCYSEDLSFFFLSKIVSHSLVVRSTQTPTPTEATTTRTTMVAPTTTRAMEGLATAVAKSKLDKHWFIGPALLHISFVSASLSYHESGF